MTSVESAWAAQLGPALSQGDPARLLSKSEQAVVNDARLLRMRTSDGTPQYPVVQFADDDDSSVLLLTRRLGRAAA